ncbi:MAG: DUF6894 family protein [Janthinobacterium lividum]
MPKYFFDAYDGRQQCTDSQGEHLEDDHEARTQADAILNALIRDDRHFGESSSYHVSVRRDEILVIYKINCALTQSWLVEQEAPL